MGRRKSYFREKKKRSGHQPSYSGLQDREWLFAPAFLLLENDMQEISCANQSGIENVIGIRTSLITPKNRGSAQVQ
jgi:hypothetical protein